MRNSFLILFLIVSCASTEAKWREVTISFKKQTWRICSEEKDGPTKSLTGFCYIGKTCKGRFMRSKICRPLPKYIPFTDKIGIAKLLHSGKVLRAKY